MIKNFSKFLVYFAFAVFLTHNIIPHCHFADHVIEHIAEKSAANDGHEEGNPFHDNHLNELIVSKTTPSGKQEIQSLVCFINEAFYSSLINTKYADFIETHHTCTQVTSLSTAHSLRAPPSLS